GVFSSILSSPVWVLLGRTPVLIGGVSSVTVPFTASAVRDQGIAGAAKVCISAAVIMLILCALRLGRYVSRVPHSVLAGFSCGIGAMMVISQLKVMLALQPTAGGWKETMLGQLCQVAVNAGKAQPIPVLLALVVIAVATG